MRNNISFRAFAKTALVLLVFAAGTAKAPAIPIFAQRYHLRCGACHSVLPELNSFGVAFREHGYQLPIAKHGTTFFALRYQNEYEETPPSGGQRFQGGGVVLGNADIGRIVAFVHYNLGAAGGPSAVYLSYLATYNPHTKTLWRGGLFELPLLQSPGQRLDDLQEYGYYGAHVGLNSLTLAAPRWGLQMERQAGNAHVGLVFDLGEYQGSAYGGAPIPTGVSSYAESPEYGLFIRQDVFPNVQIGGQFMTGNRHIVPLSNDAFNDPYNREGIFAHARFNDRYDIQAEQWWGHDNNSDGVGTIVGSSGGYVRFKFYPTPHSYFGVRYDTYATPLITQDVVYYAAVQVYFARFLLQEVHTVGQPSHLGGALTVGFPPYVKL